MQEMKQQQCKEMKQYQIRGNQETEQIPWNTECSSIRSSAEFCFTFNFSSACFSLSLDLLFEVSIYRDKVEECSRSCLSFFGYLLLCS